MTDRERLVEVIRSGLEKHESTIENYVIPIREFLSDHILADGWMRPPCKVGQIVWLTRPLNWERTEWGIKEGKISMIQQKADKSWKLRVTENHSVQDYQDDEIGKTVFLSREEAEKALRDNVPDTNVGKKGGEDDA